MIVSVVATGLFGSVLFLAAVRKFTFLGLKLAVMLFAAAGVYFVWNPDQMTRLAQMVGIGRGADLVTYATTLILFLTVVAAIMRERRSISPHPAGAAAGHPTGPFPGGGGRTWVSPAPPGGSWSPAARASSAGD